MFKVGVAGCGYWGSKHLRVFSELDECELTMFFDPDAQTRRQTAVQYPNVIGAKSFDEMLASDIDGVVIATPAATHYQLAKKALKAGKSVLVEKPFATCSRHASELLTLAERSGLTLEVGHTFLYNPAIRLVKDLISEGHLGDLLYINCSRLNFGLVQPDVDVLWDLAPHDLSILLYLLGEAPIAARARGVPYLHASQSAVAHADLLFPNEVSAHVHVSWLNPNKVRQITVVGTERMLVFDDTAGDEPVKIYDRKITRGIRSPNIRNGSRKHRPSYDFGDVRIPHVLGGEPLKAECLDFVRSSVEKRQPVSDAWVGYQVVIVLESLERSLQNEQQSLPHVTLANFENQTIVGSRTRRTA